MFGNKSFKFSGREVGILSLIFCMSLLVAFWLGYRTGHTVGFDYAQSANLSNIAKYPINDFAAPELDSDSVEEIYARLSDDVVTQAGEAKAKNEIPALAPIAETKAEISKEVIDSKSKTIAVAEKSIIANLDALPQEQTEAENVPVVVAQKKTKTADLPPAQENIESTLIAPVKEVAKVVEPKIETAKAEVMPAVVEVEKEAAVVKPVPVVETVKKTKVSPGWYAQVFAPQDKNIADKLAATLKQSGFPVIVEPASGHFRVLVGPESNKQQGQVLLQQLGREKYLPGSPFLKQVK